MIIRQIHNNKIGAYSLMLLSLFVLWIKPFYLGQTYLESAKTAMPLWEMFSFLENVKWLSPVLSFVAAAIVTLIITRYNSKYSLLGKPSALSGFIFILIISSFTSSQYFNPMWMAAIFLSFALEYLFIAYNYRKTMKECFIGAFWISLAVLLSFKLIVIVPLYFILIVILRVGSFKSLLASILGLIVPWLLLTSYELLFDNVSHVSNYMSFSLDKVMQSYHHNIYSLFYLITLSLLFIIALFSVINDYGKKKIFTRKQYQSFIFSGLFLASAMLITGFGVDFMPLIAIPFSIVIAHLIDHITSKLWQNITILSLITITVIGQLFL